MVRLFVSVIRFGACARLVCHGCHDDVCHIYGAFIVFGCVMI